MTVQQAWRSTTYPIGPTDGLEAAARVFIAERPGLVRMATRIVGDHARAEDVVQDTWLRWQGLDWSEVQRPAALLTTTTRRLAINVIQSARHRREVPVDAVADVSDDASGDPAQCAGRGADIEAALYHLMTKLTTAELGAFVLRHCFDFNYDDAAQLLGSTPATLRQRVRRARLALDRRRNRPVDQAAHARLVAAFTMASRTGDIASLVALVAPSVDAERAPCTVPTPRYSEPDRRPTPGHERAASDDRRHHPARRPSARRSAARTRG